MVNTTFASQNGKAYYFNSIPLFLRDSSDSIVGQLVKHSFEVAKAQADAWENQIHDLQKRLYEYGIDGDIIFEYDIIRLGKRIDVILLIRHMVFSMEFKNGKEIFTAQDAQQAEDYAIDIKNFHKESADLYVCPILIATDAKEYSKPQSINCYSDKQIFLQRENRDTMIKKVSEVSQLYGTDEKIDFNKWFNSPYYPTPTIIAAAVEAYNTHTVSEIAQSEAGQADIDECVKSVGRIVADAKKFKRKCLCFVTGVPGAGKTLVGLDIVAENLGEKDNSSIYVSGNGPLVEVLREALVKSTKTQGKYDRDTRTAIMALISNSYSFKEYFSKNPIAKPEHILIFDEAQRVWNEKKMARKHKDEMMACSEPQMILDIMNRHDDWAVMICLVGLGQDIYDGEVGINEWFRCGIENFLSWDIYYSPEIFSQTEDKSIDKGMIKGCSRCHEISELHLSTSIRSFRADKQSKFVDALVDNDKDTAGKVYKAIESKYPIYITRNYHEAKLWAKRQVRGSQRCGVLASSSAQRLKPEGIFVPTDIDVKNWFLAPSDDLRSSNMMEIVASEFKIQGLEIDWAVVCWDADLRRFNNSWDFYSFRGTKWMHRNKEEQKRYLLNSYRVLLTRARQGMVIFVPYGVDKEEDATRNHEYYDDIYAYLLDCGIKPLPEE